MLQERPGVWAIYNKKQTSSAASGCASAFKKLGCEAVTRKRKGEPIVYVRWPEPAKKNGAK